MKRRRTTAIVIGVVLCLVGALLWMAPFTEDGPTPGADSRPHYLTLISDAAHPVDRGRDNRLRMVYDDGSTSVTEEFPTTGSSSLARYGDGFAMASADEIMVFDRAGRTTGLIATERVASVSNAVTSPSHDAVSFAFQAPVDDDSSHKVMTMINREVFYADTGSSTRGLTVCDDRTTHWLESGDGGDLIARTMAPGRETESTEMDGSLDDIAAATFDCASGDVTMILREELPHNDGAPVIHGTGVTSAGFMTVNKDGSFRLIPFEVGDEVTEGQFDIGGGTVVTSTFDGDDVVLTHGGAGDDADLEITTFSATNPELSSDHVVVRESARALNTDTRGDFNVHQTPTVVFPL